MLASLALVGVLALQPSPSAPEDDAQALYQTAQARYDTHDYAGAIEAFTQAYARAQDIANAELRDQVLSRLAFNLARTHVSAFDVDADPQHLALARRLLADFRGHERALGRDPDRDTDIQRLEADLTAQERKLADSHADGGPSNDAQPTTTPDTASPQRARRQRNAGISLVVLSAPLAGVAIAGAVIGAGARREFETVSTGDARESAQTRGRTSDVLLGVGTALAVLSVASGATMLAISLRSRRARAQAQLLPGGLVIQGAF